MNILHISTNSTGGAGIAAIRLHQSLIENRINSNFIQSKPVTQNSCEHVFQATHFHNLKYRILHKLNILDHFSKIEKIEKKIRACDHNYECVSLPFSYYNIDKHPLIRSADIIHLHWVANFLDFQTFFKRINKPIIWTFHDMNPFLGIFHYENDIKNNKETALYDIEINLRKYKTRIYNNLENITLATPSNWLKDKCYQYNTFGRQKINVIPYTYTNTFDCNNKKEIKTNLGIWNENPTFFFIADYIDIYRKGFDLLERALTEFNMCPINLIVLGSNSNKCLKNLEQNTMLNIIPIDKTNDIDFINSLYYIADYTILPSREDNLPNVMLESISNGTPIICFKNGGMAEHINKETGILIDNITSQDLLKTIKLSISLMDKFNKNRIKNYFNETFSYPNTTLKYIDIYKKILKQQ